jgi:ankyrin repeat protein
LVQGVKRNDVSEVWQALKLGATGNVIDTDGTPILVLAARQHSTTLMELLLDHGAPLDAQAPITGYTALHQTAVGNFAAGSQFLIKKGAKQLRCATGDTPRELLHSTGSYNTGICPCNRTYTLTGHPVGGPTNHCTILS